MTKINDSLQIGKFMDLTHANYSDLEDRYDLRIFHLNVS